VGHAGQSLRQSAARKKAKPLPNSVTTTTVGPNDLAASNAARTAAKTASSSPGAKVLRRPTVTSTPSLAAA